MSSVCDISEVLLDLGLGDSATDIERAIAATSLSKAKSAVRRYLKYDPEIAVRTEYFPKEDFSALNREGVWEVDSNEAFIRRLQTSATNELQVTYLPVRETDESGNNAIDLRIDYDARSGTQSGSFAADTKKTEGTDFWPNYEKRDTSARKICLDGIIRSEGRWPSVPGSVKIVYVAGYTDDEFRGNGGDIDASPINEAVLDEAVRRVNKAYSRMKKRLAGFGTGALTSERLGDYSYTADSAILKSLVGTSMDLMGETMLKLDEGGYTNYGAMLAQ